MARSNSSNRSGRRTSSSSRTDSRGKSGGTFKGSRRSDPGKNERNAPTNSFESKKRAPRTSSQNPKFNTGQSEKPIDERRSAYKKKSFSSGPSDKPYQKRNTDDSKKRNTDDSKSQRPYKKFDKKPTAENPPRKDSDFTPRRPSTALRRERPYKKADDLSGSGENNPLSAPKPFANRKTSSNFKSREATKGKTRMDIDAPVQTGKIRLNKYIANSGVCSRREADELIKMGIISVNGKTITELGYKVNPGDEVRHESKVLKAEKPVYILLNKPKGFLTTTSDPQERHTVMHLIANAVKERVYPVGRLDRNTTGLLLLTNDGDLADKLMHPSYNAKKIYKVELDRPLTKADAQQILEGVRLEEGRAVVDDLAIISDNKRTVGIEIHIGWNRVVRRIFEALNYDVVKLDRSVYAGLDKKDLGRGEWRFLTKEELVRIKHYSKA